MKTTLKICEYQTLRVGSSGLTDELLGSLARFNERSNHSYFDIGYRSIRAKQFVGVVQVGGTTIEIIPKADKTNDIERWRNALIQMLMVCGYLKIDSPDDASLMVRRQTLLDLFLIAYLSEVTELICRGLAKRYDRRKDTVPYLKGRIVFDRQIKTQMIDKHLFVTSHDRYLIDHEIHRILKAALDVVKSSATYPDIRGRAKDLLLSFDQVKNIRPNAVSFNRIVLDRKTKGYRRAIDLAKLILHDYSPDVRAGGEPLLAIMFDMNRLFERYVAALLHRAKKKHPGLVVQTQTGRTFWGSRRVIPDIVIRSPAPSEPPLILDTKWKIVESGKPSDEDLRQMFTYNIHFGGSRSVLVYPACGATRHEPLSFRRSEACPDYLHSCQTFFIELFDADGRLDPNAGVNMLDDLIKERDVIEV